MSIVSITRRVSESIIFPTLSRFFYTSSFDSEKVDIGVVAPKSRNYRLFRYGRDYQLFPEYPGINLRVNPNPRRTNLVSFAIDKPDEVYVAGQKEYWKALGPTPNSMKMVS